MLFSRWIRLLRPVADLEVGARGWENQKTSRNILKVRLFSDWLAAESLQSLGCSMDFPGNMRAIGVPLGRLFVNGSGVKEK